MGSSSNQTKFCVTGAAGFIGARLAEQLIKSGNEVIGVDKKEFFKSRKEHQHIPFSKTLDLDEFIDSLETHLKDVKAVFHMGACSDTTELDWDYLTKNNIEYSKALWNYCASNSVAFIYASSAATYGLGENGFEDDESKITSLKPLNLYGKSKQLFDLWALEQEQKSNHPPVWSGFKFFNVYGYGEAHKNKMASVVWKSFNDIHQKGNVTLFKSHHPKFEDGKQLRDFVSIEDVVSVLEFAFQKPIQRGIFNLGTGSAQSFLDLVNAVFKALNTDTNVNFIDTPESIRDKYQYFTQATMTKLRNEGYESSFMDLAQGVECYLKEILKNSPETLSSPQSNSRIDQANP